MRRLIAQRSGADNRPVHLSPAIWTHVRVTVTTRVTYAAPFHLVADGQPIRIERTRA